MVYTDFNVFISQPWVWGFLSAFTEGTLCSHPFIIKFCHDAIFLLLMLDPQIGEGNSNPLQCFCLEIPVDRGAWWAAVYEVAQSQTQLKRLSSSSRHLDRKKFLGSVLLLLKHPLFFNRSIVDLVLCQFQVYNRVIQLCRHSCPTLCNPMDCSLPLQAPLSMGFFRQEYWSGLPFPSPGDLIDRQIGDLID